MRTQAREFCSFVHETLGKKKQGEIYNKSKNRKVNLMSIKTSVNFLVFSQLRKSYYIVVVLRDFPKIQMALTWKWAKLKSKVSDEQYTVFHSRQGGFFPFWVNATLNILFYFCFIFQRLTVLVSLHRCQRIVICSSHPKNFLWKSVLVVCFENNLHSMI